MIIEFIINLLFLLHKELQLPLIGFVKELRNGDFIIIHNLSFESGQQVLKEYTAEILTRLNVEYNTVNNVLVFDDALNELTDDQIRILIGELEFAYL